MVAHLIRLKLALLGNSLKRSTVQLVGIIIGGLYGMGAIVIVVIGLIALLFAPIELARTIIVLAGAAVILGWWLVPMLLSGIDLTLDPERFTTFAIPLRQLLLGLGIAAVLGIPGIVTLAAALGTVVTWARNPLSAVVAVICAVLAVATCVLGARALTALSSNLSSFRRFRDLSAVLLLIPLFLLGPILNGLTQGIRSFSQSMPAIADAVSFTPFGAVWAVPADVAAGNWWQAGVKFAIAIATAALLAWVWKVSLARALVTPTHSGGQRRIGGKLGAFALFPPTAWGAVAARTCTYFRRDPRYLASLILVPFLPLIFALPGLQSGNFGMLAFAGSIAVFLLTMSLSSDTSFDNTAFALHLATGVKGFDDRLGRVVGYGVLAIPFGVIYTVAGAALTDGWAMFPAQLGMMLGTALSGLGLGSIASAYFIYNVPAPGDNPFTSRPGNNFIQGLRQMGGVLVFAVICLPELILLIIALATGSVLLAWLTLAAGIILGSAVLFIGLRLGSKTYDRRAPEILTQLIAQN